MIVLTEEQQRIVDSNAPYIVVLACAGSGKTTTLTRRIGRLITEKQARPDQIAAITFTNLAADELLFRLAGLVPNPRDLSEMFVGTIHSFCLHLLRDLTGQTTEELGLLSASKQSILLNAKWREWDIAAIDPDLGKSALLDRLATTLDVVSIEGIPLDWIDDANPELGRVVRLYAGFLRDEAYIDFANILAATRDRLQSDLGLLRAVREKYSWLFVDEYQDVDPLQDEIVQLIATNQHLFVVGDDDQAIYQFRGTDVRNILKFKGCYPGAEDHVLAENRRSCDNILAVAHDIIKDNRDRIPKHMRAKRLGGAVYPIQFADVGEEAQFIASEIRRLKSSGAVDSYSDIAVLMRSVASYGEAYLAALRAADIPYVSRGGRGLFRRPEVEQIVACLEFIAKVDLSVGHLALIAPVIDCLQNWQPPQPDEPFSVHAQDWEDWGFDRLCFERLARLLSIREHYLQGKFTGLLDIVYLVIEFLDLLQPGHDESVYYNTATFTQLVADFDDIENTKKLHLLCAYLATRVAREVDEVMPEEKARASVHVLTVHQAKGLEFDVVFCPMLVERRFPSTADSRRWLIPDDYFDAARYRTGLADERRLFYVAATRARSALYLTCAMDVGLRNPVAPSIFFTQASRVPLQAVGDAAARESRAARGDVPLTLSYSSMEYYLTCPYRYKLHQVYGLAVPANPFFEFGRIVHTVIRLLHERYLSGQPVDDAVIEALYAKHFRLRYRVPAYVLESRKRAGLKAVKSYWAHYEPWFAHAAGLEAPFAYYVDDALVQGRIDLIVDHGGSCEIVDFKTGKPHEDLRRDFQVQVYSLAAINQLGLNVGQATLLYLEHDDRQSYAMDEHFLDAGAAELSDTIARIRAEEFDATPGRFCTRCEFRRLCPYRVSD